MRFKQLCICISLLCLISQTLACDCNHEHDHQYQDHYHQHQGYHQSQNQHLQHNDQQNDQHDQKIQQIQNQHKQQNHEHENKHKHVDINKSSNHRQSFLQFFEGTRLQLLQWVGFNQTSQFLFKQQILQFYSQFAKIGLSFNITHFDYYRLHIHTKPWFKQSLTCLINFINTQNQFFNQQKKFKYFAKFVKQQTAQGNSIFIAEQGSYLQKGKKFGNYLKAFFEYYYLNILRPSQTLSTTFLRALTVRCPIFSYQDISSCVQVSSHGLLAQNLQNLDINNIYIKIPQIFNAIKYLKLKKTCQSLTKIQMIKQMREKLKNVNMFNVMYNDYQPFVTIASEKFLTTQIKLLATKFAHVWYHTSQYEQYTVEGQDL